MASLMKNDVDNVWRRHSIVAAAVRFVLLTVPFGCACLAGIYTGWAMGGSNTAAWVVARIGVAGLVSTAVFVVLERLTRQVMPLGTLLRLSMVFPDRAPNRFSVALRSTSLRRLREWAKEPHHEDLRSLAEQVVTLATSLNFHDRRTRGHSERTRAIAELLIEEMGLSPAQANEVRWGAFLHDIGKLLVPAAILNKPGKPTSAEWAVLKQHPSTGGDLVEPLRSFMGEGVEAVRYHHENFDGSGYPVGLTGSAIPISARVVAVADSFEVMTAVRSYQRPMTIEAARKELVAQAGRQFDPEVVRAFLNVSLGRLHWALGAAAWLAEIPFLTVLPRAAAQVTAGLGGGATISTGALTSIATASFGAMAVVAPVSAHAPNPGAVASHSVASRGATGEVRSDGFGSHLGSIVATRSGPNSTSVSGAQPAGDSHGPTPESAASIPPSAGAQSGGSSPGTSAGDSSGGGGPGKGAIQSGGHTVTGAVAEPMNDGGAAPANSNAGGNGNGVAGANSNARGNSVAGANSNGNGVAGANSNAGGNGAAGSNNNAGGNGNGNGNGNGGASANNND